MNMSIQNCSFIKDP